MIRLVSSGGELGSTRSWKGRAKEPALLLMFRTKSITVLGATEPSTWNTNGAALTWLPPAAMVP